jgi:hypothetical protein
MLISPQPDLLPFQLLFYSKEQVVVRRGQTRRIGCAIKILEAQVGQFLLGCKCPVSRFLPGRAKDLSTPLYKYKQQGIFVLLDTKEIQRTKRTMPLFLEAASETAQCLESADFSKL